MEVQPGQTLGPYRIISQIGQGGMATVYKAYHAAMDRYVAVKVLPRQLAESQEFIGRFQQEARTIAKLEHAHILPVHDYGESEGVTYLVMRFLDAGTLKERIQARPLSLGEVDGFLTQLGEALGYAHDHGVVHRDLKPSNVLLDGHGDLFLTDFGIAKLLESSPQFTSTGAMIGTPAYMSPEQAQGQKVDQRSDIYSLGIILYEMATGRVPFEAETPLAVVLKQLNEPLPLPSTVKPDIPPAVERVILKALAKNPDDRFASVDEFLSAWKKAMAEVDTLRAPAPAEKTVSAAPTPAPATQPAMAAPTLQAAPRKGGFPRWALGVVGVVVTLGVVLLAVTAVPALRRRAARLRATPTAAPAATIAPTVIGETFGTPPPEETPPLPTAPVVAGEEWASWTAANNVEVVAAYDERIYTGGWGGVTVWDRADGTVLERYTTANGLPHPHVTAILADLEAGNLWFGTDDGLALFDGQEWTVYNDQDGLDSNTVTALGWWENYLVVGTQYSDREGGGLNLFDGAQWNATPDFPSDHPDRDPDALSNFVNAILQTADNTLWVGTSNGLGRYDGNTWTRFTTDDGLPGNNIYTLFLDADGELLVGAEAGAARFDGEKFEAGEQGPPYGVHGITQDGEGRYWFSGGGGVWRFDPDKANWEEYSEQTGDMPSYDMYGAAHDDDGNVYFGSDGSGVVRYDGEFTLWHVPNVPGLAAVGAILPAPDGRLWFVQEYGDYVDVFDPEQEAWSPGPELPGVPLTFDSAGNVWASEWQNGLWIIGGGDETHISAEQGLPTEAYVQGVAVAGDGTAWLATEQGLAFFDGQNVTQMLKAAEAGMASDFVRGVFAASDGSLWVRTETNLSRLTPDGQWEHLGAGSPFAFDVEVTDIAEAYDGALWMTTYGDGVYRFADGEWEHFSPDNSDLPWSHVRSVTLAPDGGLWFGLADRGAAHFDGSDWDDFEVDEEEGLIQANANDIYVAPDGAVWFATSGGVTRYVP